MLYLNNEANRTGLIKPITSYIRDRKTRQDSYKGNIKAGPDKKVGTGMCDNIQSEEIE